MKKHIFNTLVLLCVFFAGALAQGTSFLNRTVRIAAATPYELVLPPDDGTADQVLETDGSGNLSWDTGAGGTSGVPSNIVGFTAAGVCPSGWTEYTSLRGRYVVGLVSGGTNEGTSGTALTNLEARSVGQHTHTQDSHNHTQDAHNHTQNSHNHTQNAHSHTISGVGNDLDIDDDPATDVADDTGTATTSSTTATNNAATATNQSTVAVNQATVATNQNSGSVAGTPAPYIQLIACRKS
jgi:hypothetical protein